MSRITQHEMARKLGVSRSTVAAALNPDSPIRLKKATRDRVVRAAREWGYRPDLHARIMRGGRSGLIGMLHFGGLLQVAAERAYHAAASIRASGYGVVPADLSWSADSLEAACASLLDARVEGVVVAGLNDARAVTLLESLRRAGLPLVSLSGNPLPWAPHFRGDARSAFRDLARHLLDRGHRRLALLAEENGAYAWATEERMRGLGDTLRPDGGRIVSRFGPGGRTARAEAILVSASAAAGDDAPADPFDPFQAGARGVRRLLRASGRPTAILCANDNLALGVLQACREAGLSVPGDIAVTGYDDTAAGRIGGIPLTTVRQPSQAMAERAVSVLLDLLRAPKKGAKPTSRLELFPCQVLLRASSDAPAPRPA